MKKIYSVIIALLFLFSNVSKAQPGIHVINGFYLIDSALFTFEPGDTLWEHFIDTATNNHLWQIGTTSKSFFAAGHTSSTAIMTDTQNAYPVNADGWFVLKFSFGNINPIISFWHKYQTSAGHDGGIIEFSADTGHSWHNVLDGCNADSVTWSIGIKTDNFYSKTDTLATGEPAFSGSSSWQLSRLQFFNDLGGVVCGIEDSVFIRFRFVSDTIPDTLAGWIIDDIQIRHEEYEDIPTIRLANQLPIYPVPSQGLFNFPVLPDERNATMQITNLVGQSVIKAPYCHQVDLVNYPKGIYMYKIRTTDAYYTGQLIVR